MIEEKWKDIKGYEGLYQVSNLGNIKSFGYGKAILLKQVKDRKYLSVNLCKDKKHKKYKVHRLVAEWKGIKKINIGVKVNPSDISACCLGKQKTSKGFIWKYKEE